MPDTTRTPAGSAPRLLLIAMVFVALLLGGAFGYIMGERESTPGGEWTPPPALEPGFASDPPGDIDPSAFITVRSQSDVDATRARAIELIWGRSTLPGSVPTAHEGGLEGESAKFFEPIVTSVKTLVMVMDFGLESRAFHFQPKNGNGEVVLLHEGHDGFVLARSREIRTLLEQGYAVIALSMPLLAPNNQPELTLPSGEIIKMRWHDHLGLLTPEKGHPVQYLIEPVIRVLNYIEQTEDYRRISMVGISGGGWTTVMAAALDTRISVSVSVAGSLPMYLRALNPRDWGDWEQTIPAIFGHIGYLDLYVLGSSGCKRRQAQVFYELDPCCFAGRIALSYNEAVRNATKSLGTGDFDVVIDPIYRAHGFSPVAMNAILDSLEASEGPCS